MFQLSIQIGEASILKSERVAPPSCLGGGSMQVRLISVKSTNNLVGGLSYGQQKEVCIMMEGALYFCPT